jgi:hypothetical protein
MEASKNQKLKEFFRNRPTIPVLLICIFETIGLILLPTAFYDQTAVNYGLWYQVYLVLTGFMSIAIIYTLWKMKKVGIFIYAGSYTIHNVIAILVGNWMIGVVIIPLIGFSLIGISYKKFN